MASKYDIVNKIIREIENKASSSKQMEIYDIVEEIANRYGDFAYGSSRAVIILPNDKIVIKVPYTESGYMQNQIEYDYSNLEYCTDVYECHDFAGNDNYIIVCPYYESVMHRYDRLISEILIGDMTAREIIDLYTDEYIAKNYENIDYMLVNHVLVEVSKFESHITASEIYYNIDIDRLETTIFDIFDEYELDWYDHNIENFGINHETQTVIMMDSGLQSYDDLRQNQDGDNYVTYKILAEDNISSGNIIGPKPKLTIKEQIAYDYITA